jgi:acylphosphatase
MSETAYCYEGEAPAYDLFRIVEHHADGSVSTAFEGKFSSVAKMLKYVEDNRYDDDNGDAVLFQITEA